MGGGIADAVAANTVGRLIPASVTITAMDDPARRRLHLRSGPAGLAEFPARARFQNHFTVLVPPTGYGEPMLGHAVDMMILVRRCSLFSSTHYTPSSESRRGDPGLQAGEETPRHLPGNVSGIR
jgi:hypothetical protein